MAVVGDAYVVVRAIGDSVEKDIQRSFSGIDKVGENAGRKASQGFRKGANRGGGFRLFGETFFANSDRAVDTFRRLSVAQNFLFSAIPGVLGAIGSLGSGLLVLVGVLGQAAQGAIVFGNAIGGLVQGAITLKLAFNGVSDAISAGLDAQEQSLSNTRAQEAAARRLRDARLNLKRLIEEEKPEALAEARERAVRAEERAADASLANERAIRTYNDAQEETLDALEDLNDARDEARERIQQLRFEVEGGAISEKKARLEFEKARDSLQRVQDLPPNSRARQEAELAFAEAELNLRKAIDNNNDLKKAEEESTRAGVEGSQEVVRAKERIADAQQAEADAGIAAARAARDVGRAQEEAAEAAAAAASGGSAERDINRRISDAREQVTLAEQALGDAASSGVNQFNEALKDLSPEQQSFVKFIIAQQDALDSLRAAAGRDLFPRLEFALAIIIGKFDELEPLFQETGRILGDLAGDFATTFFQGENFERLKSVFADNNELLGQLGTAAINLAEGVLILLENASPLVEAFGQWAVNTSEAWKNTQILKDQNGELATEFERVRDRVDQVTGIFGNYKDAFGEIFDVINQPGGAGDQLLDYFETASENFKTFISEGAKDGSLNEFFKESTDSFELILEIIGKIGGGLLNLGAQEGTQQFLESISDVTDTFNDLGLRLTEKDGPTAKLGEFLEEFAKLLDLLTESGALEAFFDTLTEFTGAVNDALGSDLGQTILKAFAPIAGFLLAFATIVKPVAFLTTVFRTLFSRVIGGFKAITKFIFGGLLKAMNFFGTFAAKNIGKQGILGLLGRVAGFLSKVFFFIFRFAGPIGFIVGILTAVVPIIIQNWDKIVQFFVGLFERVKEGFQIVADFFIGIVQSIIEFISPVIEQIVRNFQVSFDIIRAIFEIFAAAFKIVFVLLGTLVQMVWDGMAAGFKALYEKFKPVLDVIGEVFGAIFGGIGDFVSGLWENIQIGFERLVERGIKPALKVLQDAFEFVSGFIERTWKGAMNLVIGLAEGFVNGFIDGLNWIIDKVNSISFPIPPLFQDLFGGEEELGFNIRKVQKVNLARLAEGGVVSATPGGILSVIGEGGRNERVEPLDSTGLSKRDRAIIDRLSGGGGATINVYPSAGMNERDLAELVSKRLAFQLRRGAA